MDGRKFIKANAGMAAALALPAVFGDQYQKAAHSILKQEVFICNSLICSIF
ncbi:hypothetical protein [Mucilaginibacter dorajii]|uniref:hypothetical protein n=1 Tax=Mucilaginibacter dorajii TaxID=692994 RepID=UPI0021681845|nr:hypothetical protein [Mucilaginibacter dorajii]MCS3732447.1 hypothetical protein [Mucilaginibacter dorajii]